MGKIGDQIIIKYNVFKAEKKFNRSIGIFYRFEA